MTLDAETCWRAFQSRDRRFDGKFFTGVTTTGIYCRPGCPARRPRRENLKFFANAAAAEEAGFRACLRCRPEAAPGSLPWDGTSGTVRRALRLIESGALDESGVDALAARLGVTDRWLRRLFTEQVGASPHTVAHTRRIHFARRLLLETELPISDVALAAGFASLRRFNQAMRDAFRRAPRDLRRGAGGVPARAAKRAGPDAAPLELRLAVREPFDPAPMMGFLGARAIPGVEEIAGGTYRRTFDVNGVRGVLAVTPLPRERAIALRVEGGSAAILQPLVERASRVFDVRTDAAPILRHLRRDPALAERLRGKRDLRVPGAFEPFELAVRAILGQQVSVRAASTLAGRLALAFGEPLPGAPSGALTHLFPTAARLRDADLSRIGLVRARAASLRTLADAVASGALDLAAPLALEDAVERLVALPGVGEWTAHYIAMRALGEPDAFPSGDLGILHALGLGGSGADRRAARERAERWRPWRSYAVFALWTCGAPPAKPSNRKSPVKPSRKERS